MAKIECTLRIGAIVLLAGAAFAAQAMVRSTDSLLPQIANDLQTTVGAASVIVNSSSCSLARTGGRVARFRAKRVEAPRRFR